MQISVIQLNLDKKKILDIPKSTTVRSDIYIIFTMNDITFHPSGFLIQDTYYVISDIQNVNYRYL